MPVGRIIAPGPFALPVSVGVDSCLAKHLADILVRGLLVAPEKNELVAVANNALPLLFKQCFKLREVLQDDADADFPRAHGGEYLVELIRERDIRKLVHHAVDMNGKLPAMNMVGAVIELLEELCVEHSDDEIE